MHEDDAVEVLVEDAAGRTVPLMGACEDPVALKLGTMTIFIT